jgi:hypothetical protein
MTADSNPSPAPSTSSEAAAPLAQPSRRKLLLRVGAAAPVVLTAVSRPVHATGACINPSGFISVATFNSRHPNAPVCTTRGPSSWLGTCNQSPRTAPYNSRFSTVFGGGRADNLRVVLGNGSEFEKYCVAAFLNANARTPGFPITKPQAQAIWTTIMGGTPPTGTTPYPATALGWDQTKTLAWLKALMSA